jgi:hypothetical protein
MIARPGCTVFSRVQPMVFGETNVKPLAHPPALIPCSCTSLGLMLAGIPPYGCVVPPAARCWELTAWH